MNRLLLFPTILACCVNMVAAQNDSVSAHLIISGYVETYYSYDLGQPTDHNRPGFVYAYHRHNEVNCNMAMLKAGYDDQKVRANIALMAGTYANANLSAEPGVLKNIYEANAGLKLSKKSNLWLDMGIFPSHIGFESAIGKDCKNVTRSILADNSPYYETGAKITLVDKTGKWLLSGLLLNGWQRIQRVNGNQAPAVGHQITYKPSNRITLNSSSFVGNDFPDNQRKMRYFHNFYGQFQLQKKVSLIAGMDVGAQQTAKGENTFSKWYAPVVIFQYTPTSKIHCAFRSEYYADAEGVIIHTGTPQGFQVQGYSLNFDYWLTSNALWRIEARSLKSRDRIFILHEQPDTRNFFFTTALSLSF